MSQFDLIAHNPQKRIKKERLSTTVNGTSWGRSFFENVYVEPVTKACMLTPLPLTEAWNTTASGEYARLRKTNYELTNDYWVEMEHGRVTGDIYLKLVQDSNSPRNEIVRTNFALEENQGMYLSWYAFNLGNSDFVQMECGWGDGIDNTISLRFYAGGDVEVAYGEVIEARYSITGEEPSLQEWRNFRQQTDSQTIDVILIPAFRRRCLLCLTNRGGGFVHVFEQFSANEPYNTITLEQPFWWFVPSGDAKVQCATLKYKDEGYITARRTFFVDAPEEDDVLNGRVFADFPKQPPYEQWDVIPRLVEVGNPDVDFVPDGVQKQARIRLDLFGDGLSTPFVYGAELFYDAVIVDTPDESLSVYEHVTSLSLSVPEVANDVTLTCELKNSEEVNNRKLNLLSNQPFLFKKNDVEIINGRSLPPDYEWTFDNSEGISRIKLQIQDSWKALDNYLLSDSYPMDGLNLGDAVSSLVKMCGFTDDDLVISTIDFDLPTAGTTADGEFAIAGKTGESPAKIIEHLHQEYAGNFYYGWKPTASGIKFHFLAPDDFPQTAATKVYLTRGAAKAEIGGSEDDNFWLWQQRVVRELSYRVVPSEANIIWVTGYDFLAKKPIMARLKNASSLDPEVEVVDRTEEWHGEPIKYGYYSPELTTKEAVVRAAQILCKRLFGSKKIYQFTSYPLFRLDNKDVPIWANDIIEVDTIGLMRVKSLSWDIKRDVTGSVAKEDRYVADAVYVCELIEEPIS